MHYIEKKHSLHISSYINVLISQNSGASEVFRRFIYTDKYIDKFINKISLGRSFEKKNPDSGKFRSKYCTQICTSP